MKFGVFAELSAALIEHRHGLDGIACRFKFKNAKWLLERVVNIVVLDADSFDGH